MQHVLYTAFGQGIRTGESDASHARSGGAIFGQIVVVFSIVITDPWGAQWTGASFAYQLRFGLPWLNFCSTRAIIPEVVCVVVFVSLLQQTYFLIEATRIKSS